MNILFINPPFQSYYATEHIFPPIGLAYLAAVVRDKGHNVSILDASINRQKKARKLKDKFWYGMEFCEIEKQLRRREFDIVGLGCFFSTRFSYALEIAKIVKSINSDIPVVIGGIHASSVPQQVLEHEEIDYAVIGEGEVTMLELIQVIEERHYDRLKQIDGIAFRENGRMFVNPKKRFIDDVDTIPFPARDLIDMNYYVNSDNFRWDLGKGRYTSIISSRGCPNTCAFCNTYMVSGRRYRGRSPKNVVDEMQFLIDKYGIEEFSFEDDNLTFDKQRFLNICKEIVIRDIRIKWNIPGGISVKTLDKEILKAMKQTGCISISLAIESGDQEVLNKLIKKATSLRHIEEVAWACKDEGFIVNGYLVMGMPGETKESINNSIRFVNRLPLDKIIISYVTPFPGTALYKQCLDNKYISQDYYNRIIYSDFVLYDKPIIDTPNLSRSELLKLRKKFFISFLFAKIRRNPKGFLSLLASFIKASQFRGKVFSMLKRYVGYG